MIVYIVAIATRDGYYGEPLAVYASMEILKADYEAVPDNENVIPGQFVYFPLEITR